MKHDACLNMLKLIFLLFSSLVSNAQVLFVCDGNTGRSYIASQMATYFLYHTSFSRGLNVKSKTVEPHAREVLMQWNIDAPHQPQQITEQDIISAKKILTMTAKQLRLLKKEYPKYQSKMEMLSICAGFPATDVSDPFGHPLSFYVNIRDQIYTYEQVIEANNWKCIK